MTLDARISEAIREAAFELHQDEALATKLTAWIDALASGNEGLADRDSVSRHLELLYSAVNLEIGDEE